MKGFVKEFLDEWNVNYYALHKYLELEILNRLGLTLLLTKYLKMNILVLVNFLKSNDGLGNLTAIYKPKRTKYGGTAL